MGAAFIALAACSSGSTDDKGITFTDSVSDMALCEMIGVVKVSPDYFSDAQDKVDAARQQLSAQSLSMGGDTVQIIEFLPEDMNSDKKQYAAHILLCQKEQI